MELSAENKIKENDSDLWEFITENKHIIPDFTRTIDNGNRWFADSDAVWKNMMRELENIPEDDVVLSILNSSDRKFCININIIRNFIESYPTVVWVNLIRNQSINKSTFKMLISANRLDFIVDTINRLKIEYGDGAMNNEVGARWAIASCKVWPKKLSISAAKEIRSTITASILIEHYSDEKSRPQCDFRMPCTSISAKWQNYYAAAGGCDSKFDDWVVWLSNMNIIFPLLDDDIASCYIRRNTKMFVSLSEDIVAKIISNLSVKNCLESIDYILSITNCPLRNGFDYYYNMNIEFINIVRRRRPDGFLQFVRDYNSVIPTNTVKYLLKINDETTKFITPSLLWKQPLYVLNIVMKNDVAINILREIVKNDGFMTTFMVKIKTSGIYSQEDNYCVDIVKNFFAAGFCDPNVYARDFIRANLPNMALASLEGGLKVNSDRIVEQNIDILIEILQTSISKNYIDIVVFLIQNNVLTRELFDNAIKNISVSSKMYNIINETWNIKTNEQH